MGQLSNSLQTLQLQEGRPNTRRGWYVRKLLEENIVSHLLNKYEKVVIKNDLFVYIEVEDFDVDLEILNLIYPDFKSIRIEAGGVFVSWIE